MNSDIVSLINNESMTIFKNTTLIDIKNDKVTFFDGKNSLIEKSSNTYEEYYEKLKKVIHPDYISKYFEAISLNNLQNLKYDYECIKYLKLSSDLSYSSYVDIIKPLDGELILILSLRCELDDKNQNEDDDLSHVTADLVLDIENIIDKIKIDSHEVGVVVKYLNELLNNVKSKNKTVLQKYQEKVTVQVNKTYESLLIVDDDNLTRSVFKKIFESDFNIIEAKNGAEAVEILENNIVNKSEEVTENIVGMFLDLKMPVMDGFGVLDYLKDKRIINRMPVVIISADDAKETKESVYTYDIADMIEKPFNYELIKKRIGNMVRMYARSNALNDLIRIQDKELKDILKSYADSYLVDYQKVNDMVAKYGRILLEKYASINEMQVDIESILKAARYYDLSLDFVPRKYIEGLKNLNEEEKEIVLNYPNIGEKIIKYIMECENDSFVKYATSIVKMHNERYDGTGFPLGMKADEIPYYVYLINVALEFVSYVIGRDNINYDEISKIINDKSGTKYPPNIVEVFNAALGEMK